MSHPLESIVLDALNERGVIDAPTLVPYLSGTSLLPYSGNAAYLAVARDALDCLTFQGEIVKNSRGWYER